MKRFSLLSAAALISLAACAAETPRPDTAMMPAGALGSNGDIDVRSLDVAAYDFANPMTGRPARAADAIAALDYMAGKLNTSPRWIDMPPLVMDQMLEARQTMRRYVGIRPDAPSQMVVDTMLGLAQAYRTGDQAAAGRLLASPIFSVPPAEVAGRLADIPRITSVNAATARADQLGASFGLPP